MPFIEEITMIERMQFPQKLPILDLFFKIEIGVAVGVAQAA
jgi:hypothetical protein